MLNTVNTAVREGGIVLLLLFVDWFCMDFTLNSSWVFKSFNNDENCFKSILYTLISCWISVIVTEPILIDEEFINGEGSVDLGTGTGSIGFFA